MTTFTVSETDFLLDGEPHRVISGALHYFRIHPDQWADRIHKARLLGLNAIETYVAWNAHEPVKGEWDVTGQNDLARFLDLIAAEGLHAIVRPGPYICAEWHNGGLPVWLSGMPGIGIRSSEPTYLREVSTYLRRVYEIVAPRQIDRGGSVILVQIENEYGAYGGDKVYLRALRDLSRECDITVPLTTVDSPAENFLERGGLPDVLRTASFGGNAAERLRLLRIAQPTGPLMVSELWDGWFDWWGTMHHTTSSQDAANTLDAVLSAGASVNMYMLHGGTNFGTTNGANDHGRYTATVTSYDYDAPLDESGHATEKFTAIREVIARYAPVPDETVDAAPDAPEFTVTLTASADWLPAAATTPPLPAPATFEELGHLGPLVRYDVALPQDAFGDADTALLVFGEVRDLAWVSVDGVPQGRLERGQYQRSVIVRRGESLTVVLEDQGRVNYGRRIGEAKGLIGPITLAGTPLEGWTAQPIDLTAVVGAPIAGAPSLGRSVLTGSFTLEAEADLFLNTSAWGKGYAYVNGFALGRYWNNGSQHTLYVPAPATRAGTNTIVVVELDHVVEARAAFVARADLGNTD